MKRGGFVAFITYILVLVFSIWMIASISSSIPDTDATDAELLVYGIATVYFFILSLVAAIWSGVMLVIKVLNLITGWKFFAVLCLVANIAVFIFVVISAIEADSIANIILATPVVVAGISEFIGLKRAA